MAIKNGYSKFYGTVCGTVDIYRGDYKVGYLPHLISAGDWNKLAPIASFDSDYILKSAVVNANYFQMRQGQADPYGTHYGVEQDGLIRGYTQAPKQAGMMVYWLDKYGVSHVDTSDNYYGSQDSGNVIFACSPYSILRYAGTSCKCTSTALGNKDNIANSQTAIIRLDNGDYALATASKCTPAKFLDYICGLDDVDDFMVMDSGGSTQMRAWTNGAMRTVVAGDGRYLPNVVCLGYPADGHREIVSETAKEEPVEKPSEGQSEKPSEGQSEKPSDTSATDISSVDVAALSAKIDDAIEHISSASEELRKVLETLKEGDR